MKVKPIKYVDGKQMDATPAEATHVIIHMPGPQSHLRLPVIINGRREGTPCWTWNGDVNAPTFKPSILTQNGHFSPGFNREKGDQCWCDYSKDQQPFRCFRCHTWVTDGKAQFLPDTSHDLVGKTVDLLEVEL